MILITGDKHGDFSSLFSLNNPTNSPVIITGDFGGIWATFKEDIKNEDKEIDKLTTLPFEVYFIDGNHENFDRLFTFPVVIKHGGITHQIRKNVFYMRRGEIFVINRIKVFAFGGAYSHDVNSGILDPNNLNDLKKIKKHQENGAHGYRIKGLTWWEQEKPSEQEMTHALANLKKHDFKVDVILTHQAPPSFEEKLPYKVNQRNSVLEEYFSDYWKFPDFLTSLLFKVDYQAWFFGHYHTDFWVSHPQAKIRNIFNQYETVEKDETNTIIVRKVN